MKIDVVNVPQGTDCASRNDIAIVIDVLRCTSVIVTALENGAEKLIPTREQYEATSLAANIGKRYCVIGGERNCKPLPDFDVGNSPFEYTRERVAGKTVIISTSNGTGAICAAGKAKRTFIGALRNSAAVAKRAANESGDVVMICAGTGGAPSAEDICAAGAIISAMLDKNGQYELTDMAQIARQLYISWKKDEFNLTSTAHCRRLRELGFDKDIAFCLEENASELVPEYSNEVITVGKC